MHEDTRGRVPTTDRPYADDAFAGVVDGTVDDDDDEYGVRRRVGGGCGGPVPHTPGARRPTVHRPGSRPRVRESPERADADPAGGQGLRGAGEGGGGIAICVDGDVPPTTTPVVVRRGGRQARGGGEGEGARPKVGRMVDGWVDGWKYGMNG